MGFWFFMLGMDLLCPIIMIIFGRIFLKAAPKDINYIYGYRTSMSMKNRDTWEFAHKLFGKIWIWTGVILLPVNVIPLIFVIGKSTDIISIVGMIVEAVNVIVIILSIFPTEIALKKTFDENGNRKTDNKDSNE